MIDINQLNEFFLTPEWLLLALALIPLLIIYLVKPKPKEQVMPSMAFFSKQNSDGKIRNALNKLLSNLLLILHLLIVITAAIAVAQPFESTPEVQDKPIIILDTSMSTEKDIDEIKNFAKDRTGTENTIISATGNAEVVMEQANEEEAENYIDSKEYKEVRQEVSEALDIAENYEGQIILASNLASLQQEEINELKERNIDIYGAEFNNEVGIIDKQINSGEVTLVIRNYLDEEIDREITLNNQEKDLVLEEQATTTITFDLEDGRNIIAIEDSTFQKDAELHLISNQDWDANLYLKEEDDYIETAIEVLGAETTENIQDSDIVVVNEQDTGQETIEEYLEDDIDIIKTYEAIEGIDSSFYNVGDSLNQDLVFKEPLRHSVSDLGIFELSEYEKSKTWTEPEEAMIKLDTDNSGNLYLMNMEREIVNHNLIFPIVWQEFVQDSTGNKPDSQLNHNLPYRAGDNVIHQQGFHEVDGELNGFNTVQSYTPVVTELSSTQEEQFTSKTSESRQDMFIGLLLFLILLDAIYLIYEGDLEY